MTQRHTPGPWRVVNVNGHTVIVIAKPGTILQYEIANFHNFSTSIEQEANARLGAAAPELLEASGLALNQLSYALQSASFEGDPVALGSISSAMKKLRAAIAKAEGRS